MGIDEVVDEAIDTNEERFEYDLPPIDDTSIAEYMDEKYCYDIYK